MVTIHRIGRFKVQLYSDDHVPPHCHIVGPDFEAVVRISDLTILRGERHRRELGPALEWVGEHSAELIELWASMNE